MEIYSGRVCNDSLIKVESVCNMVKGWFGIVWIGLPRENVFGWEGKNLDQKEGF